MPPPYCYDHPRPSVTVDLVVFALEGDALRTLLIRRKSDPFAGRWAIPGGFLEIDEPIEAAVRRELREETGLDLDRVSKVALVGVYGDPGRDPRGRVISLAHAAAVRGPLPDVAGGDDAEEARWHDPRAVSGLAFDHDKILADALAWLAREVESGPVGLDLLSEEFDAARVELLFRALGRGPGEAHGWLERRTREGRIAPVGDAGATYRATGA